MLYDPKWEVKSDPFSLQSLIAWLEQQPADKTYAYDCTGECLLAQYFTAAGYSNVFMGSLSFEHGAHHEDDLPPHFNDIAIGRPMLALPTPKTYTFGAALERARKIAAR